MADDSSTGEKTEQATPKKRKDARESGQVLKSNELVTVGMLLIMFMALQALWPSIADNILEFTGNSLSGQFSSAEPITTGALAGIMQNTVLGFLRIMLPILALALIGAVLLNVIQTGFLFSSKAMQPKMSRLNPAEGLKRIFSARGAFELLKSIAKVAIIGIVAYTQIQSNLDKFPGMMLMTLDQSIGLTADIIFSAIFMILMALAAVAFMDYMFQRNKFEKDLRMSKYEVKMEMKQQEGDPQIKGKIKQKQREMAMMRMMQQVPDADVVITNPTEYAVALKYDEKIGDAPMVVAKGKNLVAARIKELAKEHEVMIVEDKPVARSLYMYCEIGEFIPVELYQAVAEILAAVYRMKNK